MQNLNFKAQVNDIFDAQGNLIPSDIGRGVYRDDTNELLSICGPNFTPVQHQDVLSPVLKFLDDGGYDIEERSNASRSNLYDLQGKKGAWISPKITDNGAVMRTDIILGDFIQPTGASSYMLDGPDTNFFKISILNSHNSKFAVRVNTSYLRVICMNGMTQPHFSASAYGKHTANFNLDGLNAQVGNAMSMMDQDAERFGAWAQHRINLEEAKVMLQRTIAKLPNKPDGTPHFSEQLVNKILDRFRREDQTVWGLYNAVTWWQTHADFKANSDRLTATIGREQRVSSMLKSKQWREMDFAI